MARKQEQRSEETRKSILHAAGKLFREQGYSNVTIREIAKDAGCSHTAIYIYFNDKETLLHELAMPLLQELKVNLEQLSLQADLSSSEKLKAISFEFIHFSLLNQSMYTTLINANASRVDIKDPDLEINKLRNALFGLWMEVIQSSLPKTESKDLLAFTRIFFYTIHGIVTTYLNHEEVLSELLERLSPTFDTAVDVLLLGFNEKSELKREK
ncbi:TetR/AcrR family transcriptional regulator [Metabacillus herbersteinensis]|uniref:TetR/AcrR family transcriptional regulator n=1 Tax=Metabacillus herbersteinensis TaxID=283816 RepID=A0ABV6GG12_9BACI